MEIEKVNNVMNDVFNRLRAQFRLDKAKCQYEQGDESSDVSHVFTVYLQDGTRVSIHKSIAQSKHRFVEIDIDDRTDELTFPECCQSIYCDGELDETKLGQMVSLLDRVFSRD